MSTDDVHPNDHIKPDPVCPSCGSQITMEPKAKRPTLTIWQCPKCKNIEVKP